MQEVKKNDDGDDNNNNNNNNNNNLSWKNYWRTESSETIL
jgi:hypothetical protein